MAFSVVKMINFEWVRNHIIEHEYDQLKFSIEQIYNRTCEDVFNFWNRMVEKDWKECYYPPYDLHAKRKAWLDKGVIYEKYQFETDPPFGFSQCYDIHILSKRYGYEKKYFHIERESCN